MLSVEYRNCTGPSVQLSIEIERGETGDLMNTNLVTFREATLQDINKIVYLLLHDVLGKTREVYTEPLPERYITAFQAINSDPNNKLIVACYGEEVVGVQQVTFTPYLTHQGGWRATIEVDR